MKAAPPCGLLSFRAGYTFRMKQLVTYIGFAAEFIFLFIATTAIVLYLETKPYIYDTAAETVAASTVLVPGAALASPQTLAPIFIERVDMAIALYQAKKVSKILVSGDNSTLAHNEVNPARIYLMDHGIPDEDIFLDHAGFDTYSSLYRARDVFGVTSVIIATQSFHLPRAVFIARKLGMDARGVRADTGPVLAYNYVREIFADEKAVFDLAFGRAPKYLGAIIPITDDGRNYP
jgi:SanA protein